MRNLVKSKKFNTPTEGIIISDLLVNDLSKYTNDLMGCTEIIIKQVYKYVHIEVQYYSYSTTIKPIGKGHTTFVAAYAW